MIYNPNHSVEIEGGMIYICIESERDYEEVIDHIYKHDKFDMPLIKGKYHGSFDGIEMKYADDVPRLEHLKVSFKENGDTNLSASITMLESGDTLNEFLF